MHPIISFELARSRIAHSHRQPRELTTEALPAGLPPAPAGTGAATSHVPGPADHVQLRRLEKTGGWTRRERLRILWYRLRLTVQEMNYASRRMVEVQTRVAGQLPPSYAVITQPGGTPERS
jgi:hypothetical protein